MIKHTEGEWTAIIESGKSAVIVATDKKIPIAVVGNPNQFSFSVQDEYVGEGMEEERFANARLLAASKNLLEALEALTCTARTFRNVPKEEQEWTPIDDEVLNYAFAAIAEAKGE